MRLPSHSRRAPSCAAAPWGPGVLRPRERTLCVIRQKEMRSTQTVHIPSLLCAPVPADFTHETQVQIQCFRIPRRYQQRVKPARDPLESGVLPKGGLGHCTDRTRRKQPLRGVEPISQMLPVGQKQTKRVHQAWELGKVPLCPGRQRTRL